MAACLHIVIALAIVVSVFCDDIVVLKHGQLRGHRLTSRKGRDIFAFQAIPYARPPLGDLRFKPPQPSEPWEGVLDATKDAPVCIQRGLFLTDDMSGQEDCLYLNVYTPRLQNNNVDQKPLDVMFWIHGGGWQSGSGNKELYGPEYLLDNDVILVTINYRLGPLGFLSTGDYVCPGNNGLKDQVLALRWVQGNIAKFGGNPNSVTIFGESAGGASVHYHMLSPLSKGLFHRGISQSGNALCPWAHAPNGTMRYQAEKLANKLNCPTESTLDLVSCLRTKDPFKIVGAVASFLEWNIDPMIPFKPVVENEVGENDEAFIDEEPLQSLLQSGGHNIRPWMLGFNSGDGAIISTTVYGKEGLIEELNEKFDDIVTMAMFFRETAPSSEQKSIGQRIRQFYFGEEPIDGDSAKALTDLYTDGYFISGLDPAVKIHSKNEAPVYYYYFDYRGTNSFTTLFGDPTRDYGVSHLDELMYLFPQNHFFPKSKTTSEDEKMVDILTTIWTNFAHTGNPTPDNSALDKWIPVSSDNPLEYARIDSVGLHIGQNLLKERAEFWSTLPHRGRLPPAYHKEEL